MTLLQAGFEGQTNGVGATVANSDDFGDDAMASVAAGTGGTITYSTTQEAHGSNSLQFAGATAASLITYNNGSASTDWTVRGYFYLPALPPSEIQFPVICRTSANGHVTRVQLTAAGLFRIVNTAGSTIQLAATSITTATWYRYEYYGTGAGGSSGTVNFDLYTLDSTTPVLSLSGTAVSLTGGQVQILAFGKNSATAAQTWYFDDLAMNVGSSTPLGPAVTTTNKSGTDASVMTETATETGTDDGSDAQALTDVSALAAASARTDTMSLADVSSLATFGLPFFDSFTGTTGASLDPAKWDLGLTPTGGSALLNNNAAEFTAGSAGMYAGSARVSRRALVGSPADAVFRGRFQWPAGDECYPRFYVRSANTSIDGQGGYWVELNRPSNRIYMGWGSGYSNTDLISGGLPFTFAAATWYWFEFGVVGSAVKVKVWAEGTSEPAFAPVGTPGTGTASFTDTNITAGGPAGITVGGGLLGSAKWQADEIQISSAFTVMNVGTDTITVSDVSAVTSTSALVGVDTLSMSDTAARTATDQLAASDTTTMADVSALSVTLSGGDSSSLADASSASAVVAAAETHTQADAAGALGQFYAAFDTQATTDAASGSAALTAADTSSAAEASFLDDGSGSPATGDSSTFTDVSALSSALVRADTSTATEAAAGLAAASPSSDTSSLVDASALAASLATTDVSALADVAARTSADLLTTGDTSAMSDASVLAALAARVDAGTTAELAALAALMDRADASTMGEASELLIVGDGSQQPGGVLVGAASMGLVFTGTADTGATMTGTTT